MDSRGYRKKKMNKYNKKSCEICGEIEDNTTLVQMAPYSIFYKCPACIRIEYMKNNNNRTDLFYDSYKMGQMF